MNRPAARTGPPARGIALSLVIAASLAPACAWAEPSCKEALGAARGHLVAVRRTRESFLYYMKKARTALLDVPAACRDGAFYAAAASLLLQPENHGQELVLGDGALRFRKPRDALAAGLSAAPKDPDLLALVAYLSRVAPDSVPALPPDACGRLAGQDSPLRSYVCAVEALRADRAQEAARHLEAIPDPGKFPDAEALLLEALRRTGQRDEARRVTERMSKREAHLSCDPFCPQVGR